jgi:hypothetical protein
VALNHDAARASAHDVPDGGPGEPLPATAPGASVTCQFICSGPDADRFWLEQADTAMAGLA